ncbi:Ribosomal protein S11 [sediment metagenome]|uniref:Ribosomal protein S11 n=1 Tax=sediment metagenome TaxID=749907 RepID=D9PK64_9ZZZZ
MGKKRISTQSGGKKNNALRARTLSKSSQKKKKLEEGLLHVESTYNNTRVTLTDLSGNVFFTSSSGALGYKGAKKGTPFVAAQVGEVVGEQAIGAGVKKVQVKVKGVGAGRESAVRSFIGKGIEILSIKDVTPVPHNGPRPKKARRV